MHKRLNNAEDLKEVIRKIREGQNVTTADVLPFLTMERREERCEVNFKVAQAFFDVGNLLQARVLIERAWVLSNFSEEILPLYIKILKALEDYDSIQEAYKRIGMVEAVKNNVGKALEYFNQWQYTYAVFKHMDKYRYDFDILNTIENMAARWKFPQASYERKSDEKIRLAYLVFGMSHANSVIVKITRMLANYHDKESFHITLFVPESKAILKNNWNEVKNNVEYFEQCGCKVVFAPNLRDKLKRLLVLGESINKFDPHVLITSAVLADPEHFFITSLLPTPITVGLLQGPPQQFVTPNLDWAFSWSKHPLVDAPCSCSLINIGLDLPDKSKVKPITRTELDLPEDCQIIMSAGRYFKFQDLNFWRTIIDVLDILPKLYFIVSGITLEQVPFLSKLCSNDLLKRIRLLGWRRDCVEITSIADVFIDTYPSGGGHVLIDALALGIPIVSFENNYLRAFDQTDWSVADEFIEIPELIVPRGDFEVFKKVILKLLVEIDYRKKMGRLCEEQVKLIMGRPERGIKKMETVIKRLVDERLSGNSSPNKTIYAHNIKKVNLVQRFLSLFRNY